MGYQVKTVSQLTGIPRNTILAWERRYGLLNPLRSPEGHRMYSDRDVAVLEELKSLIAAGHRVGQAVLMLPRGPAVAALAS